jgi:hypothetical protein
MMIPESNTNDLGNSAKGSVHHISQNPAFMRDKKVVGGHHRQAIKDGPSYMKDDDMRRIQEP